MKERYVTIMKSFQSGNALKQSCKDVGVGKTSFYNTRSITELMEIDHTAFSEEKQKAVDEKLTLLAFSKLCKARMSHSPLNKKAKKMRVAGLLLP